MTIGINAEQEVDKDDNISIYLSLCIYINTYKCFFFKATKKDTFSKDGGF